MHWIFLGVVCLTLNCVLAEYNIKTTDYCEASSMIRSKAGCEAALLALENSPVGSTIKRFKATKVGYMARNITSPPGCFYRNSGEEVWYNHNPEVSMPGTGLGPALPIARTGVICSVSDPTHVDLCYSECPVLNQKNGIGLHDILKSTPCQTLPIGVCSEISLMEALVTIVPRSPVDYYKLLGLDTYSYWANVSKSWVCNTTQLESISNLKNSTSNLSQLATNLSSAEASEAACFWKYSITFATSGVFGGPPEGCDIFAVPRLMTPWTDVKADTQIGTCTAVPTSGAPVFISSLLECPTASEGQPACVTPIVPGLKQWQALYSREAQEPGQLQFEEGDIIVDVSSADSNGFVNGTLSSTGNRGVFPSFYIEYVREIGGYGGECICEKVPEPAFRLYPAGFGPTVETRTTLSTTTLSPKTITDYEYKALNPTLSNSMDDSDGIGDDAAIGLAIGCACAIGLVLVMIWRRIPKDVQGRRHISGSFRRGLRRTPSIVGEETIGFGSNTHRPRRGVRNATALQNKGSNKEGAPSAITETKLSDIHDAGDSDWTDSDWSEGDEVLYKEGFSRYHPDDDAESDASV